MRIRLNVEPVAKGRPKVRLFNGRVWTFTPKTTQEAQDAIKKQLEACTFEPFPPGIPLKLTAIFYRKKSKWLKGAQKRELVPVRKPDLDNMLKLLLDSIDGIVMADDAQITSIAVKKRWSKNGQGHIKVLLEEDRIK